MGVNCLIPWWLDKADRLPYTRCDATIAGETMVFKDWIPTLGDNGFFLRREHILKTKLEDFYPADTCEDMRTNGNYLYVRLNVPYLWHRTAPKGLFHFFKKRYDYIDKLYFKQTNRRYKLGDETGRILSFSLYALSVVMPALDSVKWYLRTRNVAVLLHPLVCLFTLFTYGRLVIKNMIFRHA
jgi:hypothetical protein